MNKIELIVKKNNNGWSWVISNGYGLTWVWVFLGMGIKWVWVFLGMGVKWPNCTHPFGCGPPNLTSIAPHIQLVSAATEKSYSRAPPGVLKVAERKDLRS